MLRRLTAVMAAACVSVTGLTGLVGTANASSGGASRSEGISWGDCTGRGFAGTDIRCADISVPVGWRHPRGERTMIGVAKLPVKNPEQREGSLLVNLGGPGSTVQSLPQMKDKLAGLRRWFDVIAFDPRGIGASSGVSCPTPAPNQVNLLVNLDRLAWHQFARANREWAAGCRQAAGPLAGHLDAWQVAHDMEAIRAALGEGGLNYYGNSYGTVYGQTYADLFPSQVDRMFLDSVANHTERSALQMTAPMAKVPRDEFRRFGRWCETDTDCALYPDNARDVWDKLMTKARRHPLPAPGAGDGKTVGPGQLRLSTLNPISNRSRWPQFAKALAKARAGDASDLYIPTSAPPSDTSVANLGWCSDFPFRGGWGSMAHLERQLRNIAPRIGWLNARVLYARCAGLDRQGSFPPHRIDADGLPPVLLVNGLRDQATPPAGGRTVAAQLPGSVWVRADADHGVYLDGNRCVRDIVHRYLRAGDLPEPGRSCPANEPKGAGQPRTPGH